MGKNKSKKGLEIGKDYVNVLYNNVIVIDRVGNFDNKGFYEDLYRKDNPCTNYGSWREATEEEVIEVFRRHLIHRYGKDWQTMKIKEKHPDSVLEINNGSCEVEICKCYDGWNVWNKNGMLYHNGIWVERLEEVEEPENKKIMKTAGQVFDEINGMRDGDIMEVYKVREGFKTKFQTGWTPPPSDVICPQCGKLMKFTGKTLLSNPQQDEYRCENCGNIEYKITASIAHSD